jgi:ABC-type sulfate transport system permease subunit
VQTFQTLLAAVLGAVFGAALLYGLTLCWALAVGDFGEAAFVITIAAMVVGALGGGLVGYLVARPDGPSNPD